MGQQNHHFPGVSVPCLSPQPGGVIMKTSDTGHNMNNVVDIFTGKSFSALHEERFIRLAPELDGLEMLYSNDTSSTILWIGASKKTSSIPWS